MTDDRFMSRQVFRIEAFAGDRKLDAYVIPTTKPTRRKSPSLARYDRLEPPPSAWGPLHSMDGVVITDEPVPVFVGVDMSSGEDLTAIWTRGAPNAGQAWRRAAARGQGKSGSARDQFDAQAVADEALVRAAQRLGLSPDALSGLSAPEQLFKRAK